MQSLLRLVFRIVLIAGYLPCIAAGNPMLLNRDSLRPKFIMPLTQTLSGQAAGSLLSLHVVRGSDTVDLAVAADYRRGEATLEMELLTELEQDAVYLLRWMHSGGSSSARYRTPRQTASAPAKLVRRFPQRDTVPANLLFLQFRFDSPMRPDVDAWTRVHIREDIAGAAEIPFAWRQRCFWLDSDRVLQLMIHPGRVKSGIHYGGPLLVDGRRYEISIDAGLTDARGNTLPSAGTQYIVAASEDHGVPVLESYTGKLPAGSRDPLELRFSEEMDCSGLLTGIRLTDPGGRSIGHRVGIAADGRSCSVFPSVAWPKGNCTLQLDSEIRDLGANTLRRRFEIRDAREAAKDRIPRSYRLRVR